ncbi:hypothetical protein FOCG_17875 [Fusarium oxysporum f. sp. radicis-lycopersici 26381]|nr:hypothetical protein FOCG_17875 [Fusarium oxysporum f. sp. radicis-lycopersici 26381]
MVPIPCTKQTKTLWSCLNTVREPPIHMLLSRVDHPSQNLCRRSKEFLLRSLKSRRVLNSSSLARRYNQRERVCWLKPNSSCMSWVTLPWQSAWRESMCRRLHGYHPIYLHIWMNSVIVDGICSQKHRINLLQGITTAS